MCISYDVNGSRVNFDTFQFDVDQLCADFVIKLILLGNDPKYLSLQL